MRPDVHDSHVRLPCYCCFDERTPYVPRPRKVHFVREETSFTLRRTARVFLLLTTSNVVYAGPPCAQRKRPTPADAVADKVHATALETQSTRRPQAHHQRDCAHILVRRAYTMVARGLQVELGGMSVVQFGAVPCGCAECRGAVGAVGAPAAVGAPHGGGGHHLPPALKAHEFHDKPGDQRPHFPKTVDFAGPGKATFKHS